MNSIDLSVIIPVFNAENDLMELFESLKNQKNLFYEVIAINDGSTDQSQTILEKIAQIDKRWVLISQPHQGVSVARNQGIARARGRWIAFTDSDDWLAPQAFETWVQQAEKGDLDCLVGNGFRFKLDPKKRTETLLCRQPWGKILTGREWVIQSVHKNEWPHYVFLQLVKRAFLIKNQLRFIPNMLHEDILWTTELAEVAQRMGFCAEPLYGYRINPESITQSTSIERLAHRAISYLNIIEHLLNKASSVRQDKLFCKALLKQAHRETRHFLGLMRKKLPPSQLRTQLAKKFTSLGLRTAVFKGICHPNEFWHALRINFFMAYYAQRHNRFSK
ncbi:glycosyltransferase [Candidatus Williamhamiltonella defendens]|uniref:Glycosyl transferase n=1 Tax=Candidatus Hamiltonella defensa (Bemisia tabaci) TaxID=672795 RepID=A0A249DXW2_9ENTR|nr:glycosyltransferase [Candidatus Hamiltonella defensa]ASX26383.1 glycosyl transferase [Candidatus Hamiltonella defensa (Bemisia tabaci)]CED78546.1 Glycosyltransferase group 2 [Candidatus Hamiltonella defensa (Bemisia tabaci)]